MWPCIALLASAIAWSPPRPPRCHRIRLREGAFPEPDFARGRQSLRGLWRLQRTCEDEGDCQDIVVNLKASGTFTATSQGDDEAMRAFAEKLQGRWYCDGEDQELRLARFERQSPVEWYTGMPADRDAPLSATRATSRSARTSPSGLPLRADAALARDACLAAVATAQRAELSGRGRRRTALPRLDDRRRRSLYDVDLKPDLTWESSGGFDGSSAAGVVAVARSIADTRGALDAVASLEDLLRENRAPIASGLSRPHPPRPVSRSGPRASLGPGTSTRATSTCSAASAARDGRSSCGAGGRARATRRRARAFRSTAICYLSGFWKKTTTWKSRAPPASSAWAGRRSRASSAARARELRLMCVLHR